MHTDIEKRMVNVMNSKAMRRITNGTTVFFIGLMAVFVFYGMKTGVFTNKDQLQLFISQRGVWGPLLFVGIQIVQVVFPIIPGGVTCLAGVIMFGPVWAFIYSFIGIITGSCINFYLAKQYGESFVKKMVDPSVYDKYMKKLNKGKRFDILFTAAIVLPGAPDDILCMLAGLTKMSWGKFLIIMLLGRPLSIAFYSCSAFLF